jgi:hypothetical protein
MPADHPIRVRESISVLRLTQKLRQTTALFAPASSAPVIVASFSASVVAGRPPRRHGGERAQHVVPLEKSRLPVLTLSLTCQIGTNRQFRPTETERLF